jgi:hypothetical protein
MTTLDRPAGRALAAMRRVSLAGITALVAAMAAVSFAESYRGLYLWAAGHGVTGGWVWVWPTMLDGFILVGEFALIVALADAWPFRSRIAAWAVMVTGLAASVAGNIGHVAGHDWASRATAAVPPLAAAAVLAVGLGVLKRIAGQVPATVPATVPAMTPATPATRTATPATTPVGGHQDQPSAPGKQAPGQVPTPATPATERPPVAVAGLDLAALAALDSGAKRARLAAATLGTDSPATVAAALADAGHPMTAEAARSALRNRPKPDDKGTGRLALARTGTG